MKRLGLFAIWMTVSLFWCARAVLGEGQTAIKPVDFNRDVRPILSDNCFACHGPDEKQRQGNLRLDTKDAAFGSRAGYQLILPGDASKSRLFQRISAADKGTRMPPPWSGKTLTDQQIELIRRWIDQGAPWLIHWAYVAPKRPDLPKVKDAKWPQNGIDHFVLARLESAGLKPSPEAEKSTLLRRVTLDLTSLPPTPAELDAFLKDKSPKAYEKAVDRLLASPRYGERMAARWLDAARYADTNGYQSDGERSMWPWRDWVIDAFNRNMPFNQFTIEQIAGDMFPHATLDQKIATGFNRNHRGNGEGGIIPEEYAVEYVVDRVDTTSVVWLGLSLGCARCHNHKYDPITQKEFYQVFAYFNNVPEKGRANKYGNSPPMIKAPTELQQSQLRELDLELSGAETKFTKLRPELVQVQSKWEESLDRSATITWSPPWNLMAHYPLDGNLASTTAPADGAKPVEAKVVEGESTFAPGRIGQAASFDGKRLINAGDVANFGFYDKFTLAAWIYPTAPTGALVTRALHTSEVEGYGLVLKDGKLQANFVKRWLDDALRVETASPLELNRWHHVAVTYDGSREAAGVKLYVDGEIQKLSVRLDELNQSFAAKEPLRIGGGGGPGNRFHGSIDDVHIYRSALSPQQVAVLAVPDSVGEIAAIAPANRSGAQADKIRWYFLERHAPRDFQQAWQQVLDLRTQAERLTDALPTVMVMQEREKARDTFVLVRGQYDRPSEKVGPGVPAILPALPKGTENNRLGFARWLVDPSNPLTARVTVNRFWQMYFGAGLVKTAENFGVQGEWPSHPELLDWLATEFVRTGWDVKRMQRTIVTSATYRQSSNVTPQLLEKDPDNRLLARGPRVRLSAETIRDQALAISGLLVEKIGGPPVKPYQPAGLWKELSGEEDYKQEKGENLYRRSLYTFWKRTVPPPSMMIFDSAGRETCIVRETRTNTPLQALNLMNDVTYLEASRVLAARMMKEGGKTPAERLGFAFRLATARRPSSIESKILLDSFYSHLDDYHRDRQAALNLISQGEYARDEKLAASDLAAYAAVASLILNLDETITKQ
jgi:hypothetical protein